MRKETNLGSVPSHQCCVLKCTFLLSSLDKRFTEVKALNLGLVLAGDVISCALGGILSTQYQPLLQEKPADPNLVSKLL